MYWTIDLHVGQQKLSGHIQTESNVHTSLSPGSTTSSQPKYELKRSESLGVRLCAQKQDLSLITTSCSYHIVGNFRERNFHGLVKSDHFAENFREMLKPIIGWQGMPKLRGENFRGYQWLPYTIITPRTCAGVIKVISLFVSLSVGLSVCCHHENRQILRSRHLSNS